MRSELVDRAEVMESLVREYYIRWSEQGLKLAWIEKAVNEVKPVDSINRQRLIQQLEHLNRFNNNDCPEWVFNVIKGI